MTDILSEWQHAGTPLADEPPPPIPDEDLDAEELAAKIAYERAQAIAKKVYELKIRDEAQRQLRAEQRANQPKPARIHLADFLAIDYGLPTYRITDLWPTGGRVLLTAQWKAGKTTLVGNTIRALVDDQPFLDRYPCSPGAHVVLIDDELNEATLQTWLRDQDITNTTAVSIISLRGRVATFDITDPDVRHEWAQLLTGADVIIFDCLRPVLDALGLDENHEAGRFLVAFDTLLAETGASEAMIVHHMGHHGERSRGDSRLQDWPDALWKLVRDKDDEDDTLDNPTGSRYFSAFGRDVDVRQSELKYDQATRHLTLNENAMTRPQATAHRRMVKADEAVMTIITDNPGILKTRIRKICSEDHSLGRREHVDSAVERLVERGLIVRVKQGNSHHHYLAETMLTGPSGAASGRFRNPRHPQCAQCAPMCPGREGHMCPPDPVGGGHISNTQAALPVHVPTPPTSQRVPEHTTPAPPCPDCGWPLDHEGHAAYCEETP